VGGWGGWFWGGGNNILCGGCKNLVSSEALKRQEDHRKEKKARLSWAFILKEFQRCVVAPKEGGGEPSCRKKGLFAGGEGPFIKTFLYPPKKGKDHRSFGQEGKT